MDASSTATSLLSKLPKLQETNNTTDVLDHLERVAVALQAAGKGCEVDCINPIKDFIQWESPKFDQQTDGLDESALEILDPEQRSSAQRRNVERFEDNRKRENKDMKEKQKQLYQLVKQTLGPTSIGRIRTNGAKLLKTADADRDIAYLINTLLITHTTSVVTGQSVMAVELQLNKRVTEYLTCKQGNRTIDQYVDEVSAHIEAIAIADKNVDDDGEGGFLGTISQQVYRFLDGASGPNAAEIAGLMLNGQLTEANVPHSLEDVVTLIKKWKGSGEKGVERKAPTSSILSSNIRTDDEDLEDDQDIYRNYKVSTSGKGLALKKDEVFTGQTLEQWKEARTRANAQAIDDGIVPFDKRTWKTNPGAPNPSLVSTSHCTIDGDTPCWNCLKYHPNPKTGRTSWVQCNRIWDPRCIARDLRYKARTKQRTSNKGKSTESPEKGTTTAPQTKKPAGQAAYPPAPESQNFHVRKMVAWSDLDSSDDDYDPRREPHVSIHMLSEVREDSPVKTHFVDAVEELANRRRRSLVAPNLRLRIKRTMELIKTTIDTMDPKPMTLVDELNVMCKVLRPTCVGVTRILPWYPEDRDNKFFRSEQDRRRDLKVQPPTKRSRILASSVRDEGSISTRTSGVKGVKYTRLPEGSMYKEARRAPSGTPMVCWLLDTGAAVCGFADIYGLQDVHELGSPVVVGGIVDTKHMTVRIGARLDNIEVLVDKRFSANCLPGSVIVDAGWIKEYDPDTDSYLITTNNKKRLAFERYILPDGTVSRHYMCHPQLPYTRPDTPALIAATSVQGNLAMHSMADAKAAAIAQRFLTKMGGSAAHAIKQLPKIRGVNITADHVRRAEAIYGPVRSHQQATATSVQDTAVTTELPSHRPLPVPLALEVDLCSILGVWFVIGIFLPVRYAVATRVKNHTAPIIFDALKGMIMAADKQNFDVMKIQSDGERGIQSQLLSDYCAKRKINLLTVGAGQHAPTVERLTRTVKAEAREMAARLVPRALPLDLLVQLILAAIKRINCRLSAAHVGELTPQSLWTGDTHIHAQDLDLCFGDLALATTANQKNDITPRSDTVMVCYPIHDGLHGYVVYKIATGTTLMRTYRTLKEIPWTRNDQAAIEDLAANDQYGVNLPGREQHLTPAAPSVRAFPDEDPVAPIAQAEVVQIDVDVHEPVQLPPQRAITLEEITAAARQTVRLEGAGVMPPSRPGAPMPSTASPQPEQGSGVPDPNTEPRSRTRRTSGPSSSLLNLPPPPTSPNVIPILNMSITAARTKHPEKADAAMIKEIKQMLKLKVWTPVRIQDLTDSERERIIRSSMFLKEKVTASGEPDKIKARFVGGGNLQDKALYGNVSSPTASTTAILHVAGHAAMEGRAIATMDIGGAYLNASMSPDEPPVHMTIDKHITELLTNMDPSYIPFVRTNGSLVVRLDKALYGTVQASRLWYNLITKVLKEYGFVPNPHDKCVLNMPHKDRTTMTVVVYVDDLLVSCKNPAHIDNLRKHLEQQFPEVTYHDGPVVDYVGMTIDLASRPRAAVITMKQNVDEIIKDATARTGSYTDAGDKKDITPACNDLFDINASSKPLGKQCNAYFRSMVARLLYVSKRVRPELLTAVAFLTTRVVDSTEQDMNKLTRITNYMQSAPNRGVVIEFGDNPVTHSYIDAAFALHERDRKSHSGGAIMVGIGGPLYVTSTKQSIVTKSSTEAELVAASDIASEAIHVRNFGIAQGLPTTPAVIYQDNMSTMQLIARGAPCSKRSRHIEIRNFWMAEQIESGVLKVAHCPTEQMWANLLTKPVQGHQFLKERKGLTNW